MDKDRMVFHYNRNQVESDDSDYKPAVDSTTMIIIGSTGSGKTYTMAMMTEAQYGFEGRPLFKITRKNDDRRLLENKPELKDDFGYVNFSDKDKKPGMFDPFLLGLDLPTALNKASIDYSSLAKVIAPTLFESPYPFTMAFSMLYYDIYKNVPKNHKGETKEGLVIMMEYKDFFEEIKGTKFEISPTEHQNKTVFGFKKITVGNILNVMLDLFGREKKNSSIIAISSSLLLLKNEVVGASLIGDDFSEQYFDLKKNYLIVNLEGVTVVKDEKSQEYVVNNIILGKVNDLLWEWILMRPMDKIKDIIYDEVAVLAKYDSMAQDIANNVRLVRSYNCFVYLLSQLLQDISRNEHLHVVLDNLATYLIAPPKIIGGEEYEIMRDKLNMPEGILKRLAHYSKFSKSIGRVSKSIADLGDAGERSEMETKDKTGKRIYPFAYGDSFGETNLIVVEQLDKSVNKAYERVKLA